MLSDIGCYIEVLFALSSRRHKEVWQYIVWIAAHLQYLAVAVPWIDAGKPGLFRVRREIDARGGCIADWCLGLLDATTVKTLQAVGQLRNAVAHRGALYGVTVAGDDLEHARGVYTGGHVFSDAAALQSLVNDADAAISAMGNWLRAHDPA